MKKKALTRKDQIKIAAAAIANTRGKRLGIATTHKVLDYLSQPVFNDVMSEAEAVVKALKL